MLAWESPGAARRVTCSTRPLDHPGMTPRARGWPLGSGLFQPIGGSVWRKFFRPRDAGDVSKAVTLKPSAVPISVMLPGFGEALPNRKSCTTTTALMPRARDQNVLHNILRAEARHVASKVRANSAVHARSATGAPWSARRQAKRIPATAGVSPLLAKSPENSGMARSSAPQRGARPARLPAPWLPDKREMPPLDNVEIAMPQNRSAKGRQAHRRNGGAAHANLWRRWPARRPDMGFRLQH